MLLHQRYLLSFVDGEAVGRVPRGLQPDQHGPDEAGLVYGRREARVTHQSYYPAASG